MTLPQHLPNAVSPIQMQKAVDNWLDEDIPTFDYGGGVVGNQAASARILVKSQCVLSGFPFAEAIFARLSCAVQWSVPEGTLVRIPDPATGSKRVEVGIVRGPANRLMQAERTVLEILTRSSACASYARILTEASHTLNPGWKGMVAATRKTTPGSMRVVEKYGAQIGGADPHRYSLSAMLMLKDNHIDVAGGSIPKAVQLARKLCGFAVKIEVECRSLDDALAAATAGADVVMLDNFTPDGAGAAAKTIKAKFPHVIVEVSGGINEQTIGSYARDGVDIISVGKITHGCPAIDISMKIITSKL